MNSLSANFFFFLTRVVKYKYPSNLLSKFLSCLKDFYLTVLLKLSNKLCTMKSFNPFVNCKGWSG